MQQPILRLRRQCYGRCDRWGKPAQMVFQSVDEKRTIRDWSDAELVAFLDDCKRERSEA